MKTRCDRPYSTMIAAAGALQRLPQAADANHVIALARELATAVIDLDTRMRAGLSPPRAWYEVRPSAPPNSTRGRYVLPHQPPVGTVVAPEHPSGPTRTRSWRRCPGTRDGAQTAGWIAEHDPTSPAESWLMVLRASGGSVRVLHAHGSTSHTLTWSYIPPGE